jgi:hypothetical protein
MTERRPITWTSRVMMMGMGILFGLVAIEAISRFLEDEPKSAETLDLSLQPYIMFAVNGYARNLVWRNIETKTDVPSQMRFNNLGFAETRDFSFPPNSAFVKEFGKKPQERLILITGGSVVHGVGATANDKTIAGELQRALNEKQSRYRYRVINLGMGSWIAYQEFVGLSLFGLPLRPDWVVAMDGHNDGVVVCSQGSGPGNPLEWPRLLYLSEGGQGVSYQSPLMQWLVKHTAAARIVTGQKKATPNNQVGRVYIDDDEPDPRFRMKLRGLRIADVDRQVDFYLQAQRNILDSFSSANVLLSSQPLLHDNVVTENFRKAFTLSNPPIEAESEKRRLAADLDGYMARAKDTKCDSKVASPTLGYFMARSALRLEHAVSEWSTESPNRTALYTNVEMLFPRQYGMRLPDFIDNAHLSDLGQRRIAEFFAGYILRADLGVPFDPSHYAETVLADTLSMRLASSRDVQDPPSKAPAKDPIRKGYPKGLTVRQVSPSVLRLEEEKDSGVHQITWTDVPVTDKKDNTLTLDVHFSLVDVVRLEMRDAAGSYGSSTIDLGAQQIKPSGNINAHIEDLDKGWRRITLTMPFKSDRASFTFSLMSLTGEAVEYLGVGRSIVITEPSVASNGS